VPGVLHQGILSLFEDDPWLALDLHRLERPVAGTPMDRANTLDRPPTRAGQVNPVFPDLVLVLRDPNHPKRGITFCIEAHRKHDPEKLRQIAVYVVLLEAKHRLPVVAVVVSFSRAFSRLVRSGSHWPLKDPPMVLDADNVLPMTIEQARARPTAAVLAAALHGSRGNIDVARIAIAAIQHLPEPQRDSYTSTVLAALPKRQRAILMKELPVKQRDELWEIEKRSGTFHVGRQEGRKEGRKEGIEAGYRMTILAILEVRGVAVGPSDAARIQAERSLATLELWAAAAKQVTQVSELFD
jgi:hypothetical protein